jgi:uncharacterized protein
VIPTMSKTVILLFCSNIFMTFAWYAHLRNLHDTAWYIAALASWGIALFEYLLQVPANRLGYGVLNLAQLKILQEVITLSVFVPFAVFYTHQPVKSDYLWGRCFTCVGTSDGSSKFIPIEEQPNHQIVHAFRLGKAQRATNQPLDPAPQIEVLARDFLRVLLAYVMLLGSDMPLIGPPAVSGILGDAKGLQQLVQPQEDVVLPPPEHIR